MAREAVSMERRQASSEVISFVLDKMCEDAAFAFASVMAGTRTNLEVVLNMAKDEIAPKSALARFADGFTSL
jgi:hypothetical protein